MKSLGVFQFQQKTFKMLPISAKFKAILGNIPKFFIAIIYGESGNGKTEFCIQLAKHLTEFGVVAWLSYEQGHGYDLQRAINRNDIQDCPKGSFIIIDPVANVPKGVSLFDDLVNYLSKRGSPDFIFFDSWDYTNFTFEQYKELKTRFPNKSLIFISHANGKKPRKTTGEQIEYDGGIGILVKKFIAYPMKSRFGGEGDYIIYEDRARVLNPKYFAEPPAKAGG